jgi:flagellar biogenesis protein FliO
MSLLLLLSAQNNWPSLASVGQFFYYLLIVAFVALLAYYSTKLLASARAGRNRGGKRNLELLESVGLGAQAMAQIVRAGDKLFLIGVTKERVTLLAALDGAGVELPEPAGLRLDASFDKVLQRLMHRGQKLPEDTRDEARDE